jgi:hypothetical protein
VFGRLFGIHHFTTPRKPGDRVDPRGLDGTLYALEAAPEPFATGRADVAPAIQSSFDPNLVPGMERIVRELERAD